MEAAARSQLFTFFLPSEKRWVFNWIYTHCLPELLGEDCVRANRLTLTDGDSDAYEPLQNLINERGLWGESQHGLCAWHKMLGWTKMVAPTLCSTNAKIKGMAYRRCTVSLAILSVLTCAFFDFGHLSDRRHCM